MPVYVACLFAAPFILLPPLIPLAAFLFVLWVVLRWVDGKPR